MNRKELLDKLCSMKDPWAECCNIEVQRPSSYNDGSTITLEPGVNFFALALECFGIMSIWSCEGHPGGFYITFDAPYPTALHLSGVGFFNYEILYQNGWKLRLDTHADSVEDRKSALTHAAEHWVRKLLKPLQEQLENIEVEEKAA